MLNHQFVAQINANATHVRALLIEDLVDMNGIPMSRASKLEFNGTSHVFETKVWYEFDGYDYTVYAALNEDGFLIAVLDKSEFADYEA